MGWNKNRDKLHEAAFSSVKAISKNKELTSSTGLSQRPPIDKNIVIPSAPRSSKDLNKWRGESDYQAFWHLYHKKTQEIALTCLLYTSPSPRDVEESRMPSSA